jgi:hypothetical protein
MGARLATGVLRWVVPAVAGCFSEDTVPRFSASCAPGFVALLLLAGCTGAGNDSTGATTTGTAPTTTGPDCASITAACAANQQGCVVDAAGAKCAACGAGTFVGPTGTCDAIPGTPLAHDFPDNTAASGQELIGSCRSWTLNNATELWVNAVELSQSEDSHHSNWTYVPDDKYAGPDGIWTCSDRTYDFYSGVAAGGLVYSQSTQAVHEVQKFPSGAAIRIPPHARIISDIHVLNTSPDTITGHATLTLYDLPADAVKVKLTSFHIEYDALDIPAHASARFTGDCSVAADVQKATDAPFAPKIYYVLPHTHTLATAFFAKIKGGPNDGKALLDLGGYNGEAHGRTFDPPVDMAGADGFTFGCQYTNPRTTDVLWGLGNGEMCEMFAFADSTAFFQSRVSKGAAAGTEGDVQLFSGPCTNQVFPPSN